MHTRSPLCTQTFLSGSSSERAAALIPPHARPPRLPGCQRVAVASALNHAHHSPSLILPGARRANWRRAPRASRQAARKYIPKSPLRAPQNPTAYPALPVWQRCRHLLAAPSLACCSACRAACFNARPRLPRQIACRDTGSHEQACLRATKWGRAAAQLRTARAPLRNPPA